MQAALLAAENKLTQQQTGATANQQYYDHNKKSSQATYGLKPLSSQVQGAESARSNSGLDSGSSSGSQFPPAMRSWVERAFAQCKGDDDRATTDRELRRVIEEANSAGEFWTRNWDNYPLPALSPRSPTAPIAPGYNLKAFNSEGVKASSSNVVSAASSHAYRLKQLVQEPIAPASSAYHLKCFDPVKMSEPYHNEVPVSQAYRLSFFGSENESMSSVVTARAGQMSALESEDQSDGQLCVKGGKRKKKVPRTVNDVYGDSWEYSHAEEAKRKKRLNRFDAIEVRSRESPSYDRWSSFTPYNQHQINQGGGDIELDFTVQGTCTEIEKKYLRLTSAPDPRSVRPEPILKRAIDWIASRVKTFDPEQVQANYIFLWEQLKSVRQDLTVQRIRNKFTVEVYEMHARVCLEYNDQAELKQCQAQLDVLYEEGLGTEEGRREFRAYSILYNVGKRANNNVNDMLAALSEEDRQDVFVSHALSVRSAAALGNYVALFKLYMSAPGHSQYAMNTFIEQERFSALLSIRRAYAPTFPVHVAARQLGFGQASECALWMEDHGAVLVKHDGDGDGASVLMDCKASAGKLVAYSISAKVEEERKEAQRKAERIAIRFD